MTEPSNEEARDAILNTLSVREVARCHNVMQRLSGEPWARALLAALGPIETWSRAKAGLLLELRVAGELQRFGLRPEYERQTGEGERSVDFAFTAWGLEWWIEVVGPTASNAISSALTHDSELNVWQIGLSSSNTDQRQTHAGELIRLQHLIVAKSLKFTDPVVGRFHVILADTRRIGITGVDRPDALQLAYGPAVVEPAFVAHFGGEPIKGLFETGIPLRDAVTFRERVHLLVLTEDQAYGEGTLFKDAHILPNPNLFGLRSPRAPSE